MFCPKCGTELAEGANFCPNCGTPDNANTTVVINKPVNKIILYIYMHYFCSHLYSAWSCWDSRSCKWR